MTEQSVLALRGGRPLVDDHRRLRISWPIVGDDDRQAVLAAFDRSDFSGRSSDEVYALEREFATAFESPHATAVNSATAALHAALFSLDIGPGDEVIVPNLTFIACAMAVIHSGATPVFADVTTEDFNISVDTIRPCITSRTKAVIVVHMHGIPAAISEIVQFCRARNIVIIEDVAQAPGARHSGRLVGTFGDAAVLSLMAQKNIGTCGECGILLSQSSRHKNRAEMLRIYGEIIREGSDRAYNSYTLGWNYTLNPIQAAMARVQLRKYPEVLEKIRDAGSRMNRLLQQFKWITGPINNDAVTNVFHFYRMSLKSPDATIDTKRFRRAVQNALAEEGLNVRHYQNVPLCWQPVFKQGRYRSRSPERCSVTCKVLEETFVLGAIGSSPGYLLCSGTIELYEAGLKKIDEDLDYILRYAAELSYRAPWQEVPVISDSFNATYAVFEGEFERA